MPCKNVNALTALLLFSIFATSVEARVRRVPQEYQTIQAAGNACRDGDSIVVGPGDYDHFSIVNKDNIVLIGAGMDAEERTVVHAINGNENVVAMYFEGCDGVEVTGFEVTEGWTGVWFHNCENAHFHHNYVHRNNTGWAGALTADGCTGVLIERNVMIRAHHYGLYIVWGTSDVVIRHNVLGLTTNNDAIHLDRVSNVRIYNNIMYRAGDYGIFLLNQNQNIQIGYNDLYMNRVNCNVELNQTNFSRDPGFTNVNRDDFRIGENSPCRDAGDPNSPVDADGTRADVGCYPWLLPMELLHDETPLDFGILGRGTESSLQRTIIYEADAEEAPNLLLILSVEVGGAWLSIDPQEAEMQPGDTLDVTFTAAPGGNMQLGAARGLFSIVPEEHEAIGFDLEVEAFVVAGFGNLTGVVFDELSGEGVAGAVVRLAGIPREFVADEDGLFRYDRCPAWSYAVAVDHEGFLPYRRERFEVEAGADVRLEIPLLYSACEPNPEAVEVWLQRNAEIERRVEIRNPGSGTLEFSLERVFPGIDGVEPFGKRASLPIEAITEDSRIQGVAFLNDRLYAVGGDNGDGRGRIYVINRDGELIRSQDQFMDSPWGMRDLACDPIERVLWGADGRTIFCFNQELELIDRIDGPLNPSRCLAFDPDEGVLYVNDIISDIYKLDRDGNVVARIGRPGPRIYGTAWNREDPDGQSLYFIASDADRPGALYKFNPANRDQTFLCDLAPTPLGASGCELTTGWDPLSLLLMGIIKGEVGDNPVLDMVNFYQISARTDWFRVTPLEGEVAAGGELPLSVWFTSVDLPEGVYETGIAIRHNGRGGDTFIPATLTVREGGEQVERTLRLEDGLNLVGLNVDPDVHDVRELLSPLVEINALNWVKDAHGRFYRPRSGNFCNIPGWERGEAYLLSVAGRRMFRVAGEMIPWDEPIELHQGWQTAAYYPLTPTPAPTAFEGIAEHLIIAKDVRGRFYSPRWGYSNMGDCREGQGYRLAMSVPGRLVWRTDERAMVAVTPPEPEHFGVVPATGADMSLLLLGSPGQTGEIGVFAGNELVGSGVFVGGKCGLSARGEVESAGAGASKGALLTFRWFDGSVEMEATLQAMEGEAVYSTNGFAVLRLGGEAEHPAEFGILGAFPNPFNSSTCISYSLPSSGVVRLAVYDGAGRLTATLVDDVRRNEGVHQVVWNSDQAPAGVYLCRMEAGGVRSSIKLVIVK